MRLAPFAKAAESLTALAIRFAGRSSDLLAVARKISARSLRSPSRSKVRISGTMSARSSLPLRDSPGFAPGSLLARAPLGSANPRTNMGRQGVGFWQGESRRGEGCDVIDRSDIIDDW